LTADAANFVAKREAEITVGPADRDAWRTIQAELVDVWDERRRHLDRHIEALGLDAAATELFENHIDEQVYELEKRLIARSNQPNYAYKLPRDEFELKLSRILTEIQKVILAGDTVTDACIDDQLQAHGIKALASQT
jgi:hypothetical protein